MYLFYRVEGADVHWKLYWLPVITGGAEPQFSPEGAELIRCVLLFVVKGDYKMEESMEFPAGAIPSVVKV